MDKFVGIECFVRECSLAISEDNLASILFYGGSSIAISTSELSDIDLTIFLRKRDVQHLAVLRDIISRSGITLDIPVIFLDNLPVNPDRFCFVSQGCYFLCILKRAQVLFGDNPLLKIPDPSPDAIRESLWRKISEYADAAIKQYVEKSHITTIENYRMNSRLIKAVQDILWLKTGVWQPVKARAVRMLKDASPMIFNDDQWNFVFQIVLPEQAMSFALNMNDQFLLKRLGMFESMRTSAIQIV